MSMSFWGRYLAVTNEVDEVDEAEEAEEEAAYQYIMSRHGYEGITPEESKMLENRKEQMKPGMLQAVPLDELKRRRKSLKSHSNDHQTPWELPVFFGQIAQFKKQQQQQKDSKKESPLRRTQIATQKPDTSPKNPTPRVLGK